MAEWTDAQPTMELRWLGERLQQKWKVARGGVGIGVIYTEEWRDIPVVKDYADAVD